MKELLAGDLLLLKKEAGGPRLSLFLPLSPGSPRSTKTRIRGKNLLNRAEKALRSDGLPSATLAALMDRVRGALVLARPLNENHRGLAVFADADDVRTFDVPLPLPELATVGDRFTVTPLLPTMTLQGRFFLLTLTQDRVRLLEGTALTLEPADLEGRELAAWTTMPPPRAPQVHAFLADRGGQCTRTVFHGVDSPSGERTTRALQHFRGTDRALREVLGADQPPLVLAGVRPLQALYRAVSTYPHLLESGIDGNPELISPDGLHRQAWAIAEPELRRGAATALRRYRELWGTGRTLSDPEEVRRAAIDGRVETLVVAESACAWGAGNGRSVLRLNSAAQAEAPGVHRRRHAQPWRCGVRRPRSRPARSVAHRGGAQVLTCRRSLGGRPRTQARERARRAGLPGAHRGAGPGRRRPAGPVAAPRGRHRRSPRADAGGHPPIGASRVRTVVG